jgi:hypothetical protein
MDTSVRRRLLYALASTLIVAGVLLGVLYPLSSNGVRCGTAFIDRTRTDTAAELNRLGAGYGVDPTPQACDSVRSKWRTLSLAVAGGGAILLAVGWMATGSRRSSRES